MGSAPVGAGGFPGGAPFGMPGLQELFNDPEVLMAMKVGNQTLVYLSTKLLKMQL